jgi:thioesterase domain-containing protein/acyl carrier protein
MQAQPRGLMMAVRLPLTDLAAWLEPDVVVAARNAPDLNVVSGPASAVKSLERRLSEKGIYCRVLATSHAFHSPMMDGALEPFRRALATADLQRPSRSWISCVTGDWVTPDQATDLEYWVQQLRQPVLFSDGARKLMHEGWSLLEVGPGDTLCALVRLHPGRPPRQAVVASLGREAGGDIRSMLRALGGLWVAGVSPDWPAVHSHEPRRRVPLPTYPFKRDSFWIHRVGVDSNTAAELGRSAHQGQPWGAGSRTDRKGSPNIEAPASPVRAQGASPATDTEAKVAEIFAKKLGLPSLAAQDSFFAHGGDSLLAASTIRDVNAAFGLELQVGTLFENPTVAGLADVVQRGGGQLRSLVVSLHQGEPLPLFFICGIALYERLARSLGDVCSSYGVYVPEEEAFFGHFNDTSRFSVSELARSYVHAIQQHVPAGPYAIAGISFGGLLAFEVARQLRESGHAVTGLVLLDAILPGSARRDWLRWVGRAVNNVRKKGLRHAFDRLGVAAVRRRAAGTPAPVQDRQDRTAQLTAAMRGRAAEEYLAGNPTYDGPTLVVRAGDRTALGAWHVAPDLGWSRYIAGPMTLAEASGDHLGILANERVAELISRHIERGRPGGCLTRGSS